MPERNKQLQALTSPALSSLASWQSSSRHHDGPQPPSWANCNILTGHGMEPTFEPQTLNRSPIDASLFQAREPHFGRARVLPWVTCALDDCQHGTVFSCGRSKLLSYKLQPPTREHCFLKSCALGPIRSTTRPFLNFKKRALNSKVSLDKGSSRNSGLAASSRALALGQGRKKGSMTRAQGRDELFCTFICPA